MELHALTLATRSYTLLKQEYIAMWYETVVHSGVYYNTNPVFLQARILYLHDSMMPHPDYSIATSILVLLRVVPLLRSDMWP